MSITRRRHPFLARTLAAVATFATLAAAPVLTACSDSSPAVALAPTEPTKPAEQTLVIAGTYVLENMNGQALPFADGNEFLDAMTVVLASDRTVTGTLGWHETDGDGLIIDEGTDSFTGTYTVEGNRLTILIADDEPATAVLDGDVLTVTSEGDVMVFRRR